MSLKVLSSSPVVLTRRDAVKSMGAGLSLLPLAKVLGCTGDEGAANTTSSAASSSSGGASSGPVASGSSAGTASSSSGGGASSVVSAAAWATGGTAAMTALQSYPDPFSGALPSSCALICQTTIGPCHTTSPQRQDITDGLDGIPVRLALRILNSACLPASGVIVEIWHTNHKGIYSGQINTMCNEDAEDRAAGYMRGYQVTDADGRVNFNTVFPGWYRGRCVHIHVRVQSGAYNGADNAAAEVITQLVFSDALVNGIFGTGSDAVPMYAAFGTPDTLLDTDNVVGAVTDKTPYVPDVQRMADGAMLASKTLVIRQSSSETVCSAGR